MELALHLGMPVAALDRVMTNRELGQWMAYAAKRMLPWRRVELHLAQIALVVARTMGGADKATLQDFMFDPREATAGDAEIDHEEAAAFFGATLVHVTPED